jgi:hypothetical protein
MESLSGLTGYVASTLVLLTFVAKHMRLLRTTAIFFVTYGMIEWLPPGLVVHLVLLPLNIVRLAEIICSRPGHNPNPSLPALCKLNTVYKQCNFPAVYPPLPHTTPVRRL